MTARRWPSIAETDALVELLHRGQMYGDEPYVNHVRRVSRRLREHGEWAALAGLLHDTVEDTEQTLEGLRGLGYPELVVQAVDAVTLRPGEEYDSLIYRAAGDPLGCLVKLADNLDNTWQLPRLARLSPERAIRLGKKYEAALQILEPAMVQHRDRARRAGTAIGGPIMQASA